MVHEEFRYDVGSGRVYVDDSVRVIGVHGWHGIEDGVEALDGIDFGRQCLGEMNIGAAVARLETDECLHFELSSREGWASQ